MGVEMDRIKKEHEILERYERNFRVAVWAGVMFVIILTMVMAL